MFALLLLVATAFANATGFEAAAFQAFKAVGTEDFDVALQTARIRCTAQVPDCAADIADLERRQAEALRPAPPVELPEEDPSETETVGTTNYVLYDQDPGLQYVGGLRRPPAPWTGMALTNFDGLHLGNKLAVCMFVEDTPIKLSDENLLFALSDDRGADDVFSCAVARVGYAMPLYAPDVDGGVIVHVATWSTKRQVWVVQETRRCVMPTSTRFNAGERVPEKTVTSCYHGG